MSWKFHSYTNSCGYCSVHRSSPLGRGTVSHWQSLVKHRAGCHRKSAAACPYGRGWTARSQQSVETRYMWILPPGAMWWLIPCGKVIQGKVKQHRSRGQITLILQFSSSSTFSSFRSLCTTPFWNTMNKNKEWWINLSMHSSWEVAPSNKQSIVLRDDLLWQC